MLTHTERRRQPQRPSAVRVPPVCVSGALRVARVICDACGWQVGPRHTVAVAFLVSAFTFYHSTHEPPIGSPSAGSLLMHNAPACGDASRLDARAASDTAPSLLAW